MIGATMHSLVFSPHRELHFLRRLNLNNFSVMSSPERKSKMACGPWKVLRFVLRLLFSALLLWFVLALLWAFLPSPLRDHDPDNGGLYTTSRLRAGKTLTRVYEYVPPW
jgi:uncharacterized BrkB/YihY/UPF0761 family membrane protein